MYCYNHLRNVWVKKVLNSLNDFMCGHLNNSLDEIAPELRVSPNFITFARALDKEFSICTNYPKGHGGLFRQWMKVNHPGEQLWHVERAASGARQDVAYMAALTIFWNRHYCIDFLDEILTYGDAGAKDKILESNLWILLSSVKMVAVAQLLSILHIAIIMPIR